ncbi:MAG: Gfo/Idh/MocA family oxidoreductase [Spirochaetota bacterium]
MKKSTAVIIGAGHRSLLYAEHALVKPDELAIVGVAEPDDEKRAHAAKVHSVPADRCYRTAEELAAVPKFADFAINGTMDKLHVPTSMALLKAGYDILLEKPFATNEKEMLELVKTAKKLGRRIAICHVLRYAPFYAGIKKTILDGAIGDIMNMQTTENVSYHHVAAAFIRGKWGTKKYGGSSFLMAKCCHDLDMITWLKSGIPPVRVSSMGSRMYFKPEKAPAGSGTHCMIDCPAAVESNCLYSAKKHYIDHNWWLFYVWDINDKFQGQKLPDAAEREKKLKDPSFPYGRCVWKTEADIIDHQSVVVEFADGATATHNLVSGAAKGGRSIQIIGTKGEIRGDFESGKFEINRIDPRSDKEYSQELVDTNIAGDFSGIAGAHGGGDARLIMDFVRVMNGEKPSYSYTGIEDSVNGHLTGFYADRSMEEKRQLAMPPLR